MAKLPKPGMKSKIQPLKALVKLITLGANALDFISSSLGEPRELLVELFLSSNIDVSTTKNAGALA